MTTFRKDDYTDEAHRDVMKKLYGVEPGGWKFGIGEVVDEVERHQGPGDHPSGSPQAVHGKKRLRLWMWDGESTLSGPHRTGDGGIVEYTADVPLEDGRVFSVEFNNETGYDIWDFTFYDDNLSTTKTGRGAAREVIRKVVIKLDEFIEEVRPRAVVCFSIGKSRSELYRFLARRVGRIAEGWAGVQVRRKGVQDTMTFVLLPEEGLSEIEGMMEEMNYDPTEYDIEVLR